jgi:hypothetical protein
MEESSKSSPSIAAPAWVRFAVPSVGDLIFVALLATILFTPLSSRLLGDAGIGWHIRTGQQILATHSIPRTDPFSSRMAGKPWFAWEWLYDVVVGWLNARLGLNGVVWFTGIVIAGVFAWTFRLLIFRGCNLAAALVLYLLAISASTVHLFTRPHVVGWLLTLAWFEILDSWERGGLGRMGQARLWLLPLLMLVWVNVHGGFVVGFVLLGIFWLGAVGDWFRFRGNRIEESLQRISAGKRVRDLALAGALSAGASLINPYGWKLHAHVYSYLSNRFLMEHIQEFQSPDFHGAAQKCFLILLLATIGTVTMRGRRLRMSEVLTVLFAVWTGLYATRNIPVSSVLLVLVIGPLFSEESSSLAGHATGGGIMPRIILGRISARLERMSAIERELRAHLWPMAAVILTFAIAAHGGRVGSSLVMDARFDAKRMPAAAVNYLANHEPTGPVLVPDYWGGYLIYRLYPRTLVAVDDRHDLYGAEFLKSYVKLMQGEPGWSDTLREQRVQCLLLPTDSPLSSLIIESGQWSAIYKDDVAIAFVRRTGSERTD